MSFLEEVDSGEDAAYAASIAASRHDLTSGCVDDNGNLDVSRLTAKHDHFRDVAKAGADFGKEMGQLLGILLAGLTKLCDEASESGNAGLGEHLLNTQRLVDEFRASPAPVPGADIDDSRRRLKDHCREVLRCLRRDGKRFAGLDVVQTFDVRQSGMDW